MDHLLSGGNEDHTMYGPNDPEWIEQDMEFINQHYFKTGGEVTFDADFDQTPEDEDINEASDSGSAHEEPESDHGHEQQENSNASHETIIVDFVLYCRNDTDDDWEKKATRCTAEFSTNADDNKDVLLARLRTEFVGHTKSYKERGSVPLRSLSNNSGFSVTGYAIKGIFKQVLESHTFGVIHNLGGTVTVGFDGVPLEIHWAPSEAE